MTGERPQKSFLNFIKFLKKEKNLRGLDLPFKSFRALDLGAGECKNAAFLAERGAKVFAVDISSRSLKKAEGLYKHLDIEFINSDMLTMLSTTQDDYFDLATDIMSSHLLSSKEREKLLKDLNRVLKNKAFLFVRTFLLDGDKNAKYLIKKYPGKENNTYILPNFGMQEKVFTIKEFKELYLRYFDIITLKRETHYSKFNSKSYKRNYIVAYLKNRK